MKKSIFLITIFLAGSFSLANAVTITSKANAAWNLTTTWDLGRVPIAGDDVIIATDVNITANPGLTFGTLAINGGSKTILNISNGVDVTFTAMSFNAPQTVLNLYGKLRVSSISIVAAKADVNIFPTGQLFVSGNVSMTGPNQDFSIANSGTATVGGDFLLNKSNSSATISGSLAIAGTLTNNGTVTVPSGGTLDAGAYAGTNPPVGTGTILLNGVPLPIELTYFQAYNNKTNVTINWQTATEKNNDYFTIERSKDGLNYDVIGTVRGAGTSMTALNYSFTDYNPVNGVSYYRLTQTDYDGKFEVFSPVSVSYLNEGDLKVGPNPAISELNISVPGTMGTGTVKLYNVIGAVVKSMELDNNANIDVSDLPKGNYIMVITAGSINITKKIMVH